MFLVRGVAVCLSIAIVLYAGLSVTVCLIWQRVQRLGRCYSAQFCADLLFALRISPLFIAGMVTLFLSAPSFLLLEPQNVVEPLGVVPIVLALCSGAMGVAGIWNAWSALLRAWNMSARWESGASLVEVRSIDTKRTIRLLQGSAVSPPLATAGLLTYSVWLSQAARRALSLRELHCALQHEIAHVRRRDNLRKLILRLVAFPGMAELESAWREATEMAADDAAVNTASEALDLAGAVIKLSRFAPVEPAAELVVWLVHSPVESVNIRVRRLLAWTEPPPFSLPASSARYVWCAAILGGLTLVASYSHLLVALHAATEWLVR
jgi:hypothetical protein